MCCGFMRFVEMFVMDRYSVNQEIGVAPRLLVQVVAIGATAYLGVGSAATRLLRLR